MPAPTGSRTCLMTWCCRGAGGRRGVDGTGAVPAGTVLVRSPATIGETRRIEGIERIGETAIGTVDEARAHAPGDRTRLTDRLGERGELVVLCRRCREAALAPEHLPSARDGDPTRMFVAQIPGMGLLRCRQRTDDRGRLGVDECQGSHRGSGAAGTAAQSGKLHATRLARRAREGIGDTHGRRRAPEETRPAPTS